jgi:hypothetical protein
MSGAVGGGGAKEKIAKIAMIAKIAGIERPESAVDWVQPSLTGFVLFFIGEALIFVVHFFEGAH